MNLDKYFDTLKLFEIYKYFKIIEFKINNNGYFNCICYFNCIFTKDNNNNYKIISAFIDYIPSIDDNYNPILLILKHPNYYYNKNELNFESIKNLYDIVFSRDIKYEQLPINEQMIFSEYRKEINKLNVLQNITKKMKDLYGNEFNFKSVINKKIIILKEILTLPIIKEFNNNIIKEINQIIEKLENINIYDKTGIYEAIEKCIKSIQIEHYKNLIVNKIKPNFKFI